jgi:hypothetical protein
LKFWTRLFIYLFYCATLKKKTSWAKPRLNHRKVWGGPLKGFMACEVPLLPDWVCHPRTKASILNYSEKHFLVRLSNSNLRQIPHCPRFHASSKLLVLCWYSWLSSNDRCFPQSLFEPPIAGDESISLGRAHFYRCFGITEQNTKGHKEKNTKQKVP